MEYNSFYGGRRGASFIIVKSFKTIDEMKTAFRKGGNYTTVNYDEYVLIDTENKNNKDNGKIYRRGYDYTNDMGGAEYVGQIVGPAGLGPHVALTTISGVQTQYNKAIADKLDYRHESGNYAVSTSSLVPGKNGSTYNDTISWEFCSVRDNSSLETTAYIGFKIPYTVVEFSTNTVEPYNASGDYADMTSATRIDDKSHPFYEKWNIVVPKGIKGDIITNFRVYTPTSNTTLKDNAGTSHTLTAGKQYLVYDYTKYDNKKAGETTTLYLGVYDMISGVTLADNGTLTITYTNKNTTTYTKKIKWITSASLNTTTGAFNITYNTGDKYDTTLDWVRNITIADNGTMTTTYTNTATKTETNKFKWIDTVLVNDTNTTSNGDLSIKYNYGDAEKLVHLKYIKNVAVADNGTVTINYNDTTKDEFSKKLKWVTGTTLAADGTLTINYNTGASDVLSSNKIKWIKSSNVNGTTGLLTITYNDNTTYTSTLKYPNKVELTSDSKLKFTFTNNDTTTLDLIINSIVETAIPQTGDYQYHLLILNSAPAYQGSITYNGKNGWQDLGIVKDYDGILIGLNVDSSSHPEYETESGAIAYLNTNYPNGLTGNNLNGKIAAVGRADQEKKMYAYDYKTKVWFYLGSTSGAATIKSVYHGKYDASNIPQEAKDLATGSLWFVVEEV